eukprot:TRINITY_DN1611_c0_g2_i1.p1 TRINITY_DN1611_c0_g2~~TRINITY_DN1611_c0_g2_i1.p1  ORF type:complete len:351 (+),score=23.98 TRINITY_DN1611_c0_g2_i1:68-1120(+)
MKKIVKVGMVMFLWAAVMTMWVVNIGAPRTPVAVSPHVQQTPSPATPSPPFHTPYPTSQKITVTVSATKSDENGFPRLPLLLSSLRKFGLSWIHEVILTVPDTDVTHTANLIKIDGHDSLSVRIIPESRLLPTNHTELGRLTPKRERTENGGRGTGYRLSMVLKLAVALEVTTDYYITMDCDTFLKRHVTFSDLIKDNGTRAIIQGYNDGRHRRSWWDSSAAVLKTRRVTDPPFIGVTPAILSSKISRSLLSTLTTHYDSFLMTALSVPSTSDWTEYTLYWTFASMNDLVSVHHVASQGLRLYDVSGFEWGSFKRMNLKKLFASREVFGVVQSINGAPAQTVIKALEPFF